MGNRDPHIGNVPNSANPVSEIEYPVNSRKLHGQRSRLPSEAQYDEVLWDTRKDGTQNGLPYMEAKKIEVPLWLAIRRW